MATKRKGVVTVAQSFNGWWKHLRPYGKRMFWKAERKAAKREAAS